MGTQRIGQERGAAPLTAHHEDRVFRERYTLECDNPIEQQA